MTSLDPSIDCIGYIRVSTERQAGEVFTSLDDQRRAIEQLAARLGTHVGRWFADEGASGATVDGRPAFRDMLTSCLHHPRRATRPGYVLALNDSRFGRFPDPDEAAALRFRLKQHHWIVRFCESDEIEDPTFRTVVRALGSAQASEYRRALQRNTRRGMRGAAEQGFWTRREPLGYRRQVVYPPGRERVLAPGELKRPDEKVKLTPERSEEAPLVRWIFERYVAGAASLGSLVRDLEARAPMRAWSRRTVQAVLRNPVYVGDVVGGRRRGADAPAGLYGRDDAHEAIVSRELWTAAQARLAANRKATRAVTSSYALSGLIRCTHCGRFYTGGGGSRQPHGASWKFYKCSGGVARLKPCPGRIGTVGRELLDAAVIRVLSQEIAKPAVARAIEMELDRQLARAAGAPAEDAAHGRRALEQRRDRLVAAIAEGTLTQAEAARQLADVRARIAATEDARNAARFAARRSQTAQLERDRLLSLALDFPRVAASLRGSALRELVRPWLADATFDKTTRALTLVIQRVPHVQALQSFASPGQAVQEKGRGRTVTRVVDLRQRAPGRRVAV